MHHDLRRGALYMAVAALLFAAMGVTVKLAAETLSNVQVVFFRNAFGLVALSPWLFRLGLGGLGTRAAPEHLVRGLAGLAAMYCFFYALAHLRLADAVLLNYSLPLFLPFVERAWSGEAVPRGLWPALVLGFAGILVILRPGLGLLHPAALVGLLAAACAALAQVGIRRLTRTEPTTRIVFYFAVVSTAVSALPLPFAWRAAPAPQAWALLAATGILATIAQLFLTRAYAEAPAAQVGPFIYSSVVFAGLLDWLFWRRLPDIPFLVGAAMVGAAGIMTLRRLGVPEQPAA